MKLQAKLLDYFLRSNKSNINQCHSIAGLWCERCLLITESPKTPGHYRYLIWVLGYILYGIGGAQFAISRVPVYTAISNFQSSCSQRFRVEVASN